MKIYPYPYFFICLTSCGKSGIIDLNESLANALQINSKGDFIRRIARINCGVIVMIIKQISIFIENRPGRLAEVTEIIAKNNINIRALSIADTTNFGILRIIVDNPELVEEKLRENNITASITSVLSVAIEDRPGGLAEVLQLLSDHGIAIEYMYAFLAKKDNEAYVIMRIEKDEAARRLLEAKGYHGLS